MKIYRSRSKRPFAIIVLALSVASAVAAPALAPAPSPVSSSVAPTSRTFPNTCFSNLSPGESINTFGGFAVSGNIWNPGTSAYKQCTSATIRSPGGVINAEFDWNFASSNSTVKTYPNIQFGQQNSYRPSTTPLLPAPISALPSLMVTGTATTTCISGPCIYDTAIDIFVSRSPKSAPQIEGELMIMTDYNIPDLDGFATWWPVTIDGASYKIRHFQMKSGARSWPYVAYFATSPMTQIRLNINKFVADAVNRGYLPASYYLDMVSFGTEVQTGHGITKITNYNIQ
ncbi:MAG: hypothetical protein EPN79_06690 [Burkholderiaceae bacterium]|nr:MAG: hypothetical protein EPN79_06690 [Burkholderiaceae bacterium]TBR75638.1 MAG: hypothetical protein EPN64_11855 [Burkholderiaceae bacterium]